MATPEKCPRSQDTSHQEGSSSSPRKRQLFPLSSLAPGAPFPLWGSASPFVPCYGAPGPGQPLSAQGRHRPQRQGLAGQWPSLSGGWLEQDTSCPYSKTKSPVSRGVGGTADEDTIVMFSIVFLLLLSLLPGLDRPVAFSLEVPRSLGPPGPPTPLASSVHPVKSVSDALAWGVGWVGWG